MAEPAIVYCQDGLSTTVGKTAHGLIRFSRRFEVLAVVDRQHVGKDAGTVVLGSPNGIPVLASIPEAVSYCQKRGTPAATLVIGLAPDGGKLSGTQRQEVLGAVKLGLHIVSGLHQFLSEDPDFRREAERAGVRILDVRKPPPREQLHFFSGKIREVKAVRIAVLGTDSAVGKRTTAWLIVDGLNARGLKAELVGTGQTAWLQGARYSIMLDSLVNDFVTGEIEHAVWTAWQEQRPQAIVVEGQGSLLHPAYPGGFEILAAARPELIVLQHAPARTAYDGFPDYPMDPLPRQIQAVELISGKTVTAVTLNHEGYRPEEIPALLRKIEKETGIPTFDPLFEGPERLARYLAEKVRGLEQS